MAELPKINMSEIEKKFPISYEQSLNTPIVQDIVKYNHLTKFING